MCEDGPIREMHLPHVTESQKVKPNKPKATRFVMVEMKFKPIHGGPCCTTE